MAYNFSANQFEDGYKAKRLRNWEVPRWFPSHPRTPLSTTRFIADSRGHLLPGVPKANPWGSYQDTWELPKRITKDLAEQLNAPSRKLQALWCKRRAPPQIRQQIDQSEPERLPILNAVAGDSFNKRNKSSTALDLRASTPQKLEPILPPTGQQNTPNIEPGTLNEEIKQILDDNYIEEKKSESPSLCRAIETLQKCDKDKEREENFEKIRKENLQEMISEQKKNGECHSGEYPTFQVAKRFHDENLKHQPLPDVVDDPVFKALASNKDPFPGRALDVQPNAVAIGWKSSGAPGPTKCSKVKVYRPKTSIVKSKSMSRLDGRPKTCEPQKEKRFAPIELAICWDLAPEEKPPRSQHIDGSGGGEGPSVFAVVKPEDREICVAGSSQAVATHVMSSVEENNVGTLPPKIGEKIEKQKYKVINKSAIMSQVKQLDSPVQSFHSLSPESAEIARKNPKTAWTNHDTSKALSERLQDLQENKNPSRESSSAVQSTPLSKKHHYRSTPNLATGTKKQCDGSNCGTESPSDKASKDSKNGIRSNGHSPIPQPVKNIKMPKMRPPYAKKNYSISTLIPPFSLWPDHHGQEYPEHWRLASVYQHSYKPVDCRRKPLLASVFQ